MGCFINIIIFVYSGDYSKMFKEDSAILNRLIKNMKRMNDDRYDYSVLLRKKTINIHPISLLTTLIFMGSLCILPFYVWEYKNFSGFDLNMSTFLIFLFLAIFPSILSYISWNFGVKVVGSGRASLFMYLLPVFTSVLAFLFLGESIAVYHISGGIIILTGLIMSSY